MKTLEINDSYEAILLMAALEEKMKTEWRNYRFYQKNKAMSAYGQTNSKFHFEQMNSLRNRIVKAHGLQHLKEAA